MEYVNSHPSYVNYSTTQPGSAVSAGKCTKARKCAAVRPEAEGIQAEDFYECRHGLVKCVETCPHGRNGRHKGNING